MSMRLQALFDLGTSSDLVTFERRLVVLANNLEFEIATASLVTPAPGADVLFQTVGNTPDIYKAIFDDPELGRQSPVLQQLKATSLPFAYDQKFYLSKGKAEMWEQQAQYGYRTGVAVALHLPHDRHFILGFDRAKALPRDEDSLVTTFATLQLVAVHAHDAAARLLTPGTAEDRDPQLTNRQIEILRWTMAGKSAWAIGEILSLNENTVNFHLRKVLRKLDSTSKHQAVLKAMALGLI